MTFSIALPAVELEVSVFHVALVTFLCVATPIAWGMVSFILGRRVKVLPALASLADPEVLASAQEGTQWAYKKTVYSYLASEKAFQVNPEEYDLDRDSQQALAHTRTKRFVEGGFVSVRDLTENTAQFLAAHEAMALTDPSTIYFFSVHFNLFGGSLWKLGTKKHHDQHLQAVDSFDKLGCFALTEFAHGVNSGFFLFTTATYDKEKQEFVINTPNPGAQKTWISFAKTHAQVAIVFAQLIIDGEDKGVHAFWVPVRDSKGKTLKGVRIEDQGHKPCLNGNDNGRLFFDRVRVPRSALLDKHSQVAEDGTFTSSIENLRDRFLKVADQLISGRMAIGASSNVLSKMAVLLAIRYSCSRIQGRGKGREMPVFENLTQKRALLPIVAQTYAATYALDYVKGLYCDLSMLETRGLTEKDLPCPREDIVTMVCAFKGYIAQAAVANVSACREKTGGQGLMSVNRLGELSNVAASVVVVEGDSMLLAQKTSKWLLDKAKAAFGGSLGLLLRGCAATLGHNVGVATTWAASGVSPALFSALLAARRHILTMQLASALAGKQPGGMHMLEAWSKVHLDLVIKLSRAFVEQTMYEKLAEGVRRAPAAARQHVAAMRDIFALSTLEADLAFFLGETYLPKAAGAAITAALNAELVRITPQNALDLVAGFGFPEELLSSAPISSDAWITSAE